MPEVPSGNRNLLLYSADPWQAPKTGYYQFYGTAKTSETYNGSVVYKAQGIWNRLGINLNNHLVERGLLKVGDVLTYSVLAKTDQETPIQSRLFVRYDNQSGMENINGKNEIINLTNEWQKISVTFTVTEKMLSEDHRVNYLGWELTSNAESGKYVYYACNKIERGNVATPYSPAPEDSGWSMATLVPTQEQRYLWKFEYIYYSDGSVEVTQPANLSIAGVDGIAGKDGVGLKSTVVTYGLSASETTQPTSWASQVPTLTKGNYLWTKTVWTYTDNTNETGYQKTYIAKDGNDGNDGIAGKDGVGIKSTTITYASSTSGTNKPTSGWSSTIPSVPAGNYLWTKTTWTYTDNTSESGYSVAKMGEIGAKGDKGDTGERGPQGIQGPKGADGTNGQTSHVHFAFADNATGGGFSLTTPKAYMGWYADFNETASNDPTKYKWGKWKGDQGVRGDKGDDGKTSYLHLAFASSADGRTGFSFTESGQQYQGYYTDFTQTSSTDPTKYTWMDRRAGVKVGGRNLLVKTNQGTTNWDWTLADGDHSAEEIKVDGVRAVKLIKGTKTANTSWNYIQYKGLLRKLIQPNTQYVLSFDVMPSVNVSFIAMLKRGDGQAMLTDSVRMNQALANQWTRVSCVLTSKVTLPDDLSQVVYLQGMSTANGNWLIIKNIKLEEGNVPTPWTPALEDTQSDIDSKADQALTQQQLNALAEQNSIVKAEMEAKAGIDTVNQWITAYQNYVNANDEAKAESERNLQEASARILQLKTDVGTLRQQWDFIDTYMTVQNEGLIIGKSDGSAYAKFANDRISLFSGSSEVMYISQGVLRIENGIFTKTIQIGRFRFETHPADADMLVLRYLGG